ncbi:PH domain-containing protein [Streptomyces sp. PU_AKi4]|uniref:PH domain-containing protein n=1 Tax=Streptomyces sp. PU_AKi4 TaxID=2800809 RepID=UPI0035258CBB
MLVLLGTVYPGIIWFHRAATIVYRDHLAVRRLFRTRRTVWSDVLSSESGSASRRTTLLDREGRLFALPGGVGARPHEARAIKDRWVRSRGEGWTPPGRRLRTGGPTPCFGARICDGVVHSPGRRAVPCAAGVRARP